MPVILVFRRWRQENLKFEAGLSNIRREGEGKRQTDRETERTEDLFHLG